MKTIWKYKLEVNDFQEIQMPIGAKELTVQLQHGEPHLWALVDTEQELIGVQVLTFGTGHEIERYDEIEMDYVGTYQLRGGSLIFHVFTTSI